MGVEWYVERIFKDFPSGVGIAVAVFLGVLLVTWLLLPLWVLFIQWNTGKIKDEIRYLVDLMEMKEQDGRKKNPSTTTDE